MNRLRVSLLAAIVLIVPASVVWSAPVPSARSGLEQVPATAPIVIHVRGVQGTRDRLVAMMENALPDVLKKFQTQMDEALKDGIEGRKIRGLAKDGPIFFIFTELPKPDGRFHDPPPIAVILAVSNYKEFRDNMLTEEERKNIKGQRQRHRVRDDSERTKPTYFLDRKGYAVITPDKKVAKSFTKKFSRTEQISKELADKLLNADLGVFVNMDTSTRNTPIRSRKPAKASTGSSTDRRRAPGKNRRKKSSRWSRRPSAPSSRRLRTCRGSWRRWRCGRAAWLCICKAR